MQWLRTVDSSLHSTVDSSSTAQHPAPSNPARYPAPPRSGQQPAQHPAQHLCQTSLDRQPAQHSTMPDFVPPAAPLKISVNSSLAQPAACCIAFARPREPAARCTARFPDFTAAANSSLPQPVQHPGQHSTSARLRHRTVSSSLTAGLHSTLHSTFARTSQPQSEHQPAHHHAQDHSTAPLPDFATALTAPTAACTAPCTAPLPDFATKSATEDLTFEKYRTPIASSYLGKKDFAVILGGSSQKNHGRSPMRTEVIGPPTCARC